MSGSSVFRGTRPQHIARVVFLLRYCGLDPGDGAPGGAVTEMRSGQRLQACDFWMRNPDYLADALVDDYEAGERPDGITLAQRILDDREPQLRRLPMTKWRFGAYEELSDVLAPLLLYGLVEHRPVVRGGHSIGEHDYWLMPEGVEFTNALLEADRSLFGWYVDRARLIATVAKDTGGSALKARQYGRIEYASTPGMALIPSITDAVRVRLVRTEASAA
ncbi:MAG: hypothetical protein ITG02_15200 [Patulibacter sp.]|nr:hypothetical protein [Patulibacter sp.]